VEGKELPYGKKIYVTKIGLRDFGFYLHIGWVCGATIVRCLRYMWWLDYGVVSGWWLRYRWWR